MKVLIISMLLSLWMSPQQEPQKMQRAVMATLDTYKWEMLAPTGDVTGRHECSFIEFEDKFYLLGGRGINDVGIYDPKTNHWSSGAKSPIQIHHFQAVVYGDAIYMVGAMSGKYPVEQPLENVWIYYPHRDEWVKGDVIPKEHRRGGAGTVVQDDKIYIVGGIELGHTSGTTNLFSCYDPHTGEWTTLTKAPHIRDHFSAVTVNGLLYCIGGRNGSVHHKDNFGAFFDAVESAVDVYDFKTGEWYTLKEPLPTPTAAAGVVAIGSNIVYIGGEGHNPLAYNQTQCLSTHTGKWRELSPMVKGMHGSSALYYEGAIFWAAGSYKKGGSNLGEMQRFSR